MGAIRLRYSVAILISSSVMATILLRRSALFISVPTLYERLFLFAR